MIPKAFRLCLVFLSAAGVLHAQTTVLIREVVSREYSIHVGGVQTPEIREIASREMSLFILNGPADPYHQVVSREISVAVTTPEPPPRLRPVVRASPAGDRVDLDWSAYNQWAVRDVARFDVYLSDRPFTNVVGLTRVLSVNAESIGATFTGLPTFRDHFLAVVAVDALGNTDPVVSYAGAYVISPEAVSREVTFFIGAEPEPPYRQVVSREVSVVITTPEPPAIVTDITRDASPSGNSVRLNWDAYNQWAERDVARYDIYFSDRPFTNVSGMTRYAVVPGETLSVTLPGLPELRDHFFAVVPVDGLGNFTAGVRYAGVYIISPEAVSREVAVFIGAEPIPPYREVVSREISVLRPSLSTPEPVTGLESGFRVATSRARPRALDLDWAGYNEVAQQDVVRYRVYVGSQFFETVRGLSPAAFVADGQQRFLLNGLTSATVYHVAIVAEDALGQFDPAVRSVSAITTPAMEMSIPDLSGDELLPLNYQLTVTEADLREYVLNFGILGGPPGLTVAPGGALEWTPTEAQGPGTFPVVVSVTDNGVPPVTATDEFTVTVREVNLPPSVRPVSDRRLDPGDRLSLRLDVSDADLPVNLLTYSLLEGPPGLAVAGDGGLEWATSIEARPSTSRVVVRVSDDGMPAMSAEVTFLVVIANTPPILAIRLVPAEPPAPMRVEIRFPTDPGFSYRLEATPSLSMAAWAPVNSIAGTGELVALTDEIAGLPERYYRVVVE